MQAPPYSQLARQFLELWQTQMSTVLNDREFIRSMVETVRAKRSPRVRPCQRLVKVDEGEGRKIGCTRPLAVVTCYPSNPTAYVADLDFYKELVPFAKKHGIFILSDLAYAEVYFDDNPPPSRKLAMSRSMIASR